ncbi:MAG TPA: PilZ domain-containing protein [Allosphingosinicella sp.]|nr:PilZ domain-containing protein [Allosphingosinicella sp.]
MASAALPRAPTAERRGEPRLACAGASSVLIFRGTSYPAPVLDISARGTMIESDISPRLGESVMIHFDGCSPIYAFVRWAKDGRVGLNFGCELIVG